MITLHTEAVVLLLYEVVLDGEKEKGKREDEERRCEGMKEEKENTLVREGSESN